MENPTAASLTIEWNSSILLPNLAIAHLGGPNVTKLKMTNISKELSNFVKNYRLHMQEMGNGNGLMRRNSSKKKVLKHSWIQFLETTSFEGLRNIHYSKEPCERILWTLLFILAAFTSVYFSVKTIASYMENPIATSFTTEWNNSMLLPNLAICHLGGPNVTKLKMMNISEELSDFIICNFLPANWRLRCLKNMHNSTEMELVNFLKFRNLTFDEILRQVSFTCEDLVTISNQPHICQQSRIIAHPYTGTCISLRRFAQNVPGMDGGLLFKVTVPPKEHLYNGMRYHSGFAKAFAFEIGHPSWHSNLHTLASSIDGVLQLGLSVVVYERLQSRKGGCLTSDSVSSSASCYFLCNNKQTLAECGCLDAHFSETNFKNMTNICTPLQLFKCNEHLLSTRNVTIEQLINDCQKNCQPLCYETRFDRTVTFMGLSPKRKFKQPSAQCLKCKSKEQEQKLIIIMAYPNFIIEKIEEKTVLTLEMVIGGIGGQVGLWLGCSLMSFVHLLVYLLQFCFHIRKDVGHNLNTHFSQARSSFKSLRHFRTMYDGDVFTVKNAGYFITVIFFNQMAQKMKRCRIKTIVYICKKWEMEMVCVNVMPANADGIICDACGIVDVWPDLYCDGIIRNTGRYGCATLATTKSIFMNTDAYGALPTSGSSSYPWRLFPDLLDDTDTERDEASQSGNRINEVDVGEADIHDRVRQIKNK
ncbi:Acid-sensing ion channel 4 [Trichinella nelsoni]|uniref:Acid-sensing ion channel 4 n=1 Tax=Trichinella nelsoni TaxID=6336 RepID=A0A0V0RXU4_9BILA|nr:Acid-sensing ion channel 4 [Trichinella nelsoni]